MDPQTDGLTDGWMDKWAKPLIEVHFATKKRLFRQFISLPHDKNNPSNHNLRHKSDKRAVYEDH